MGHIGLESLGVTLLGLLSFWLQAANLQLVEQCEQMMEVLHPHHLYTTEEWNNWDHPHKNGALAFQLIASPSQNPRPMLNFLWKNTEADNISEIGTPTHAYATVTRINIHRVAKPQPFSFP